MIWRSITSVVFILVSIAGKTQSNIIQNAQAIRTQQWEIVYNTEGYEVIQKDYEFSFDEKGFNKIKKKLDLPKETQLHDSPDFPNVKMIETSSIQNGITHHSVYYVSTPRWGIMKVVSFTTNCTRLPEVEKEFYTEIIKKTLPPSVYTSLQVDTVLFAGRPIDLGSSCQWMNVRNLQCPNYGQMNWSEFTDSVRAKQSLDNQKIENANSETFRITNETEVTVIFEGQEVKSLKRTVTTDTPPALMGGSNVLIVYYVLANVRGRYVSCVLSHYSNDVGAKQNKLPPLLAEVMQLKE